MGPVLSALGACADGIFRLQRLPDLCISYTPIIVLTPGSGSHMVSQLQNNPKLLILSG